MEIMIPEEGLAKSYSSCEQVGLDLLSKIVDSPEDYVFLLKPKEWNELLQLHETLRKLLLMTKTLDAKWKLTNDFIKENASNPISLIIILSTHPEVGKLYKLCNITPIDLEDCFAIFFTKEDQVIRRSEEIKEKILQFRAEQAKNLPLS